MAVVNFSNFQWAMLIVVVGGGIAFLVLSFFKGSDYVNNRHYCVHGHGDLVYPGPGASSGTYCQGSTRFHRSESFIAWRWIHNLSSPVMSIVIKGPVLDTNPLTGPLLLTLCQTGTDAPCIFPSANVLQQRIDSTVDGLPLADYIEQITFHAQNYLIYVNTVDFPNGEVAMNLFSLCYLCGFPNKQSFHRGQGQKFAFPLARSNFIERKKSTSEPSGNR